jgi:hypothetical protein
MSASKFLLRDGGQILRLMRLLEFSFIGWGYSLAPFQNGLSLKPTPKAVVLVHGTCHEFIIEAHTVMWHEMATFGQTAFAAKAIAKKRASPETSKQTNFKKVMARSRPETAT